ncbi:MAG: hypothetical protein K8R23_00360 [Chthoniobacter sp.]|nr:hypothetical protein [Chthoniobacter sp.]
MRLSPFRCPFACVLLVGLWAQGSLVAGPYSAGLNDPTSTTDAPIPGFVGPDGEGLARLDDGFGIINERNYVNPLFFDWAASVTSYAPAPGVSSAYAQPGATLGPVTGDHFDVASLGDRSDGGTPGKITLHFAHPIQNLTGADFTVFENAFFQGGGAANLFGELAYVEVSADGVNFVRFPSRSLTAAAVGQYGTINPTNVFNLAGKHVNAFGDSWGTPFDLADVGLASVSYVRLVDIPGTGTYLDSTGHAIYDPLLTIVSGGADIEAVGAISRLMTFDAWQDLRGLTGGNRGADVDPDGDGASNVIEYAFTRLPDQPDATAGPVQVESNADRLEIIFTRDERATDLTYEVQVRDNLATGSWTTIASSAAGQPVAGVGGFTPTITETSASAIASVGVIRRVCVADVQTISGHAARFLRVKITQSAP